MSFIDLLDDSVTTAGTGLLSTRWMGFDRSNVVMYVM